ncbi:MAG: endonuclease NucS [Halobacteriaceae archaeon]
MTVLEAPALDAAAEAIRTAVTEGALVTITGRCRVTYDGDKSGRLSPGDRVVLLKPDGTTLVHGPSGYQPGAWRPAGATVSVTLDDTSLQIRANDPDGDPSITIQLEVVHHVQALSIEETGERTVSRTEADLKERVLSNPELVESGFRPLATERETRAGAVDVYGEDADGRTVAVELKQRRAGPDAVSQLARYVDALAASSPADREVRGVLLAPGLTPKARRRLAKRGLSFVPVD